MWCRPPPPPAPGESSVTTSTINPQSSTSLISPITTGAEIHLGLMKSRGYRASCGDWENLGGRWTNSRSSRRWLWGVFLLESLSWGERGVEKYQILGFKCATDLRSHLVPNPTGFWGVHSTTLLKPLSIFLKEMRNKFYFSTIIYYPFQHRTYLRHKTAVLKGSLWSS